MLMITINQYIEDIVKHNDMPMLISISKQDKYIPYLDNAMLFTAQYDRLDMFKYIHSLGVFVDSIVLEMAIVCNHQDMAIYMIDNTDVFLSLDVIELIHEPGNEEILKCVNDNR